MTRRAEGSTEELRNRCAGLRQSIREQWEEAYIENIELTRGVGMGRLKRVGRDYLEKNSSASFASSRTGEVSSLRTNELRTCCSDSA